MKKAMRKRTRRAFFTAVMIAATLPAGLLFSCKKQAKESNLESGKPGVAQEKEAEAVLTPTGSVDFEGQFKKGLSNVTPDGLAYCLVYSDAGAGHRYYDSYFSRDKGKTWTKGTFYDEINGDNTHIAMQDGSIVLFSNHSPRGETYPSAFRLYPEGKGIKSEGLGDIFAGAKLGDGRAVDSGIDVNYEVTYLGKERFLFHFTDAQTKEDLGTVEVSVPKAGSF
ncbi:MAG: exo-alpha-sialidase [Treponema sp.]|nr:exo-alpha-sialidase [Treponema sp.]